MKDGTKIKKIIRELNLTGQELSDALGISRQYFSKIKNSQARLSREKIAILCRKFNVSADWFVADKGEPFVRNEGKPAKKQPESSDNEPAGESSMNFTEFSQGIGLFSSYIKTVFTVLDKNNLKSSLDDKLITAASLFFKDIVFTNTPLSQADSLLEKFESEIKDTAAFKDRVLDEYYNNFLESRS